MAILLTIIATIILILCSYQFAIHDYSKPIADLTKHIFSSIVALVILLIIIIRKKTTVKKESYEHGRKNENKEKIL